MFVLSTECPHCFKSFRTRHKTVIEPEFSAVGRIAIVFVCPLCEGIVIVEADGTAELREAAVSEKAVFIDEGFSVLRSYPQNMLPQIHPWIPGVIKTKLIEVESCIKGGQINAGSMMLRSAIETAFLVAGAKGNSLNQMIFELKTKGTLPEHFAFVSDLARRLGNEAAHEITTNTNAALSRLILIYELALYVVEFLHVLPVRLKILNQDA